MRQLLDFPDEILCEIFGYLSTFDILHSFTTLNSRFNRLTKPFKRQIDLTHLSYEHFMYYIDVILPIVADDQSLNVIKSGNKRTPGQLELLDTLISDRDRRHYFNEIQTFLIESPRLSEKHESIDRCLQNLPNLTALSIQIDYICDHQYEKWTQLILQSIFAIPTLTRLSIEIPRGLVLAHLPTDLMLHSLITVKLNISLVTDLLLLIQRIPNVENLSICVNWWASGDQTVGKMLAEMHSKQKDDHRTSYLIHLKKFYLIIDSTITFQFEHLEQVLYRILNSETTSNFTFIFRSGLNHPSDSTELIDGQRWEKLLFLYSALKQFYLSIRFTACLSTESEQKLISFRSKYFLERQWLFSYFKYAVHGNAVFHSIPNRTNEVFDISINDEERLNSFLVNSASNVLIDQKDNQNYYFSQTNFHALLNQFPFLEELHLISLKINLSQSTAVNIQSLRTLKIEKNLNVNLSDVLQLFPLINTLHIPFSIAYNERKAFEIDRYNRIIELSINNIAGGSINVVLLFLEQFPCLKVLRIHIQNRRMTDESLLTHLNELIQACQSLICLKLQLEKTIDTLTDWNSQFNGRVQRSLTDTVFDGVLTHLWFK